MYMYVFWLQTIYQSFCTQMFKCASVCESLTLYLFNVCYLLLTQTKDIHVVVHFNKFPSILHDNSINWHHKMLLSLTSFVRYIALR